MCAYKLFSYLLLLLLPDCGRRRACRMEIVWGVFKMYFVCLNIFSYLLLLLPVCASAAASVLETYTVAAARTQIIVAWRVCARFH